MVSFACWILRAATSYIDTQYSIVYHVIQYCLICLVTLAAAFRLLIFPGFTQYCVCVCGQKYTPPKTISKKNSTLLQIIIERKYSQCMYLYASLYHLCTHTLTKGSEVPLAWSDWAREEQLTTVTCKLMDQIIDQFIDQIFYQYIVMLLINILIN